MQNCKSLNNIRMVSKNTGLYKGDMFHAFGVYNG